MNAENFYCWDCMTTEDVQRVFGLYRNKTMRMNWIIAVQNISLIPEDLRNEAYLLFLQPPGCQINLRDTQY